MNGVTFDGALIGLERRTERMKAGISDFRPPASGDDSGSMAEWYREQRDARRSRSPRRWSPLPRTCGARRQRTGAGGNNAIDAIVMASAAQRGDIVYTSDVDDLLGFADVFPSVRVFGVGGS